MNLEDKYWSERYSAGSTGWDIGKVSKPIEEYIDQLSNKDLKILIPGSGNSHEAACLLEQNFTNITCIDISGVLVDQCQLKFKKEIKEGRFKIKHGNFFELDEKYDLIIEQTFFCAIDISLRQNYAEKVKELLSANGKLVGLLFQIPYSNSRPFGGDRTEYLGYFNDLFNNVSIEPCYNSIKPRAGNELWINIS